MPDPGKDWSWKQNPLNTSLVSSCMPTFTDLSYGRLIFQEKISKAEVLHPKLVKLAAWLCNRVRLGHIFLENFQSKILLCCFGLNLKLQVRSKDVATNMTHFQSKGNFHEKPWKWRQASLAESYRPWSKGKTMTNSVNSVLPLLIYYDREDLHELDEMSQNKSELKYPLFIKNFTEIIILKKISRKKLLLPI